MTNVLSRSLPAPINWQDFERLTFDLFKRMWNSDDIQMHGRSGQAQSGVDVYGTDYRLGKENACFVGVQCKGKDADYGHNITRKELEDEVKKALKFHPPLDKFFLVTTAQNDEGIQKVARLITESHRKLNLFEVHVMAWGTLRQHITDYPDLLEKHFPDLAPRKLDEQVSALVARQEKGLEQQNQMLQKVELLLQSPNYGAELGGNEDSSDPLAKSILTIADQINDGSPAAALKALQRLLKSDGEAASKLALFRIHANIGNAYMVLGSEKDAIAAFLKAHKVYPEYSNARATLALAKAMSGDREQALALAQSVLSEDPTSRRAAALVIDLTPDETPVELIEAGLPSELVAQFETKVGLSIRAQRGGQGDKSLQYAEEAYRLKPGDWRTASGLAEALLAPLAARDMFPITGALDLGSQAILDRAIALNTAAWEILEAQDSTFQGRHVAANLVSQLLLVGKHDDAWKVLARALTDSPEYPPLLQREAQRLAGADDWLGVRKVIQKIPAEKREFEDGIMLAQCAWHLQDTYGAEEIIERLTALARLPEQQEYVAGLAVNIRLLGEEDSRDVIQNALDCYPNSIVMRSLILEGAQKVEGLGQRIIREIRHLINHDISIRERVLAAEAFIDVGDFSTAADLYSVISTKQHSSALYRRLQALYRADRRAEARALFEALPQEVRARPAYKQLGVAIYEQAGLLEPAIGLLEDGFATEDRLVDRLRWVQFLMRIGDLRFVQWLRDVPLDLSGSPEELVLLAQFVDKYLPGDLRALELGYRAVRSGYGEPQVHLGYAFGLFLQGAARREDLVTPSIIEPGCGVRLVDESGKVERFYVIETGEKPAAERRELAPSHPLAKDLIGKAVGEFVSIGSGVGRAVNYRVVEVQSCYVFAFQRTLREFSTLFPGHPALSMVTIDASKDAEESLEPVLELVRQRAKHAQDIEDYYDGGPMPLFILSKFAGASVFDLWEGFTGRKGKSFKVALGHQQEFQIAQRAVGVGLLIVDPLTIYAWARLGILETMRKFTNRLAVVQSSIDMLRQLQSEREDQRGQSFGSMVWDGERYHMIEATEDVVEQRIADAQAAAAFASELVLVPSESSIALPGKVVKLIADTAPAFSDTLLASLNEGQALLTDDFGLRVIAQECAIPCAWTQTFLQAMVPEGLVSPSHYRACIASLISRHYDFTQIGWLEILQELIEAGWRVNDRLRAFANVLAMPNVDKDSLVNLLADLIFHVAGMQPGPAQEAGFHIALMDAFTSMGRETELLAIYDASVQGLHVRFRRLHPRRSTRRALLETTQLTPPAAIAQSIHDAAQSLVRKTCETILAGGLRFPQAKPIVTEGGNT